MVDRTEIKNHYLQDLILNNAMMMKMTTVAL